MVVDKQRKTAVLIDVAIPNDKDDKKLEKYQGLRKAFEKMWRVKITGVPVVIRALGTLCSQAR